MEFSIPTLETAVVSTWFFYFTQKIPRSCMKIDVFQLNLMKDELDPICYIFMRLRYDVYA